MTLELIDFCIEHHIILVMRPPHCTHVLQGEDVVSFKNIKADFMKEKQKLLTRLHFEGLRAKPPRLGPSSMGFQHFCRTIKPVWDKHFSEERNKIAWQRIGVAPFTRCVYWDLLRRERERAEALQRISLPGSEELNFADAHAVAFGSSTSAQADAGGDGSAEDEAGSTRAPGATRLSSADLWKTPVTRVSGREKIAAKAAEQAAKKQKKEESAAARERADIEKRMAAREMATSIFARLTDPDDSDIEDVHDLTVAELKAILTDKGVKVPSKANKEDLRRLVREHVCFE